MMEHNAGMVASPVDLPAANAPKPRLLFVEDEVTLRDHLAERLSDEYLVDTAGNGNEALLAVMRAKPALVVTDIVMPDMDGVELLKTLRQTPGTRGIPVLLISGRAADEHRIEGFEEGADGFLPKPYTERELRALIGSMLRSARMRADAAGREAREQAVQQAVIERATLLESITDAFYALDRQWRFTYVNRRALDYYGKERVELLGKSLWDVFPLTRGSALEEQYLRALREQCSVSFETLSPLNGRWVEVHAYPTPQGLAVNFRDISERKQIEGELQRTLAELHAREEQLRQNQQQLASEVDAMRRLHELVNRLLGCNDLQTALEEVLDAAIALLGAEMGNVQLFDPQTRKLRIVAHRGFREDFLEHFRGVAADPGAVRVRAAQEGQRAIVEDVQTDPGFASHRAIAASAGFRAVQSTPVTSRSGELLGVLSTHFHNPHRPSERALRMVDLYARQAAEFLERMRVEASLKEADRRKSEFLAVLAHELRNPLAPLRNGLQILRLRAFIDELSQRTVNMMDRQLSHLVHLVDDLLDVGRITRGNIALNREKILLTDVLASAVEASRPLIEAHAQELVIDLRPTGPVIIDGDHHRLAQVFSNLLSNSARYTDRGGTITLQLDRDGGQAVVSVHDTGIGIPAHALEEVFEMFSQLRPDDARSVGGLGIGLSLVRTLTQLHGGSVSAASGGAGAGSVFTVRLPIVQQGLAASAAGTVIADNPPAQGAPHRVLVVDDNRDAASSLALLLQMSGHEVHTAADGQEAIERAAQLRPSIIFMDLGMPKMGGVEAARRIRALPHGRDIAIVALTGWAQESDRERTRSAGMDYHLVKPVSSEALRDVFDKATAKDRNADPGQSGDLPR
jgi:PAS domain S-box-containing protein